MNKALVMAAGTVLLAGTVGVANARLIIETPTGVTIGNVTVFNFGDNNGVFNLSATDIEGQINFFDQSCQGPGCHVKADGIVTFDPDAGGPTPTIPFIFNDRTIFAGPLFSADWNIDTIGFGAFDNRPADGTVIGTVSYQGASSLFSSAGIAPFPLNGSIAIQLTSSTATSVDLQFIEVVNVGGTSIENQVLPALDALGGAPNGSLDGPMTISQGATLEVPEPTSLALLGLGLAGAGFARRQKKAA